MAKSTPDQVAADWAARLAQSTDKISRGVGSVTVAPGQAAARQKAVYLQNVQAAGDKWAANVGKVTLSDWQNAMTTKGVQRIASGAQAAQPKMQAFMTKLLPYIDNGRGQLPARGTFDQNMARLTKWVNYMHQFSGK